MKYNTSSTVFEGRVLIDRMLADLAVMDPVAFSKIVEVARKELNPEGTE